MITVNCLVTMMWKHSSPFDRISLWEGESGTGRWLGMFPADAIPDEHKKRIVKCFETEGKDDDYYDFICITVE